MTSSTTLRSAPHPVCPALSFSSVRLATMRDHIPWIVLVVLVAAAFVPGAMGWNLNSNYWNPLWALLGSLGTLAAATWRSHMEKKLEIEAKGKDASRAERLEYSKRLVEAYDASLIQSERNDHTSMARGNLGHIRTYKAAVLRVAAYGDDKVRDAAAELARFLENTTKVPPKSSNDVGFWCTINTEELQARQLALANAVRTQLLGLI